MLISCWSVKGGAGTTVVATALALVLGSTGRESVLVDLAGDAPAALGLGEAPDDGLAEWLDAGGDVPPDGLARLESPVRPGVTLLARGRGSFARRDRFEGLTRRLRTAPRPLVVDCGRIADSSDADSGANELQLELARVATHSLLVTRACYLSLRRVMGAPLRPSGVVLVAETGRCLDVTDVEQVVGVPVVARVDVEPSVARAVDAGLLASRVPRGLARALRSVA
jgi:hypothetical protein